MGSQREALPVPSNRPCSWRHFGDDLLRGHVSGTFKIVNKRSHSRSRRSEDARVTADSVASDKRRSTASRSPFNLSNSTRSNGADGDAASSRSNRRARVRRVDSSECVGVTNVIAVWWDGVHPTDQSRCGARRKRRSTSSARATSPPTPVPLDVSRRSLTSLPVLRRGQIASGFRLKT